MTREQKPPELFLSLPHECSYLPDRQASSLFVDPTSLRAANYYDPLLQKGFRRSGRLIYRPYCNGCSECVSVRIPVREFQPRRGQKRILQRNTDVRIMETAPVFNEEHYRLYRKYQHARHTDGSMDNDDRKAYEDFLVQSPVDTRFLELRVDIAPGETRLLAVAVTDVVDNGLSAVYTFFDPDASRRGPGVLAILKQIEWTRKLELDYLYLGYWIKNCDKMSYKQDYRPLQGFRQDRWLILES